MYGIINACIKDLILHKFGPEGWLKVQQKTSASDSLFFRNQYAPDSETISLVVAAAENLGIDASILWKMIGAHFVTYCIHNGYANMLRCLGSTLREWLSNLNRLHLHLKTALPLLVAPKFWALDSDEDGSMELHYFSERGAGLENLVEGIVIESAMRFFDMEVTMDLLSIQGINGNDNTTWRLRLRPLTSRQSDSYSALQEPPTNMIAALLTEDEYDQDNSPRQCPFSSMAPQDVSNMASAVRRELDDLTLSADYSEPKKTLTTNKQNSVQQRMKKSAPIGIGMQLTHSQLAMLFPFHVVLQENFDGNIRSATIHQVGPRLQDVVTRELNGLAPNAVFSVNHCEQVLLQSWDSILAEARRRGNQEDVITSSVTPILVDVSIPAIDLKCVIQPSEGYTCVTQDEPLRLRGTLLCTELTSTTMQIHFLLQPVVHSLETMVAQGLSMNDYSANPAGGDFLLQAEHIRSEIGQHTKMEKQHMLLEKVALQRSIDMKRTFVRYTSHEIRTPMMIMQMCLPVIEKSKCVQFSQEKDRKMVQEAITDCSVALDSAVRILTDLLDYEKLDSGVADMSNLKFLSAVEFTSHAIDIFFIQAQAKAVDLQIIVDGSRSEYLNGKQSGTACISKLSSSAPLDSFLHGDEKKLQQALRNLLSNAIKCTHVGGVIKVFLSTVKDMPEEFLKYIENDNGDLQSSPRSGLRRKSSSRRFVLPIIDANSTVNYLVSNEEETKTNEVNPDNISSTLSGISSHAITSEASTSKKYMHAGYFIVDVQDTGEGISKADQLLIYDQFKKFNPQELQGGGGSGLGLWITSELVRLHGGALFVHSEGIGHGSVFSVCLPVYKSTTPQVPSTRPPLLSKPSLMIRRDSRKSADGSSSVGSNHGGRDKVTFSSPKKSFYMTKDEPVELTSLPSHFTFLVVDDSSLIRKVELAMLRSAGFICGEAADGEFAVEMIQQWLSAPPNTVLIPQISPVMPVTETPSGNSRSSASSRKAFLRTPPPSTDQNDHIGKSATPHHVPKPPSLNLNSLPSINDHPPSSATSHLQPIDNPNNAGVTVSSPKTPIRTPSGRVSPSFGLTSTPDVILMDYVMPRCDGPKAIQRIRALGYNGLIIGITGNALPEEQDYMMDSGADAVLTKPVKSENLFACILIKLNEKRVDNAEDLIAEETHDVET